MVVRFKWVFLVYRLPRQPSTPRIALWRRLRRLGVVQVTDGVVAVPLDARTKEQLERMAQAVAAEYRAVMAEAAAAARERAVAPRRAVRRLRRELRTIRAPDFFPPPEAAAARRAVEALAEALEASA